MSENQLENQLQVKKIRILIGKVGLDGHDRGAKVIAAAFRDAGIEVIYTGLRQTPETIVEAALQEDVDAIGISILSGAHMTIFPKVKKLMDDKISCAITAPTNKAASVIGELMLKNNINKTPKTIHSFLGIKPYIDYKTGVESFVVDKKAKKSPVDVLIVDESSMISTELFELICEALDTNLVRYVLFVGDPNQLLPISGSSNTIFELKNQYKLIEIMRQAKDSYIIDIATKIKDMIENKKYLPLDEFFKENIYNEI